MADKNVYWFSELSRASLPVAGGKGANLGEMFNAGFPVPEGYVVSAQAYRAFVEQSGLAEVIKRETGSLNVQDNDALQAASERVMAAIVAARVPEDIRTDITRAYNQMCGSEMPAPSQEVWVACRSSATAEDLPEASFAGQQATYLNVRGAADVVLNVQKCWASLFEARAIFYRQEHGFDHLKVAIAVPVQRMVQSEAAGVMFCADPVTSDVSVVTIEGAFGLGEAVVSGSVTPDRYLVRKSDLVITSKTIAKQERMITKTPTGGDMWADVPQELQEHQKIPDDTIVKLASIARDLEKHYNFPQDIEWAVEGKKTYIVQTRAITTLKGKTGAAPSASSAGISADDAKVLTHGLAASPGVASGPVRKVADQKELTRVKQGDVLVTHMTDPNYVPAMKRASAIVTDAGGVTSHAAIVSRELGIPCIVGTGDATKVLAEDQVITVDATHGMVYDGKVEMNEPKPAAASGPAFASAPASVITGTKVYMNMAEPDAAEKNAAYDVDGVGLFRAEFLMAQIGVHPLKLVKEGKRDQFIDALAKGLRKTCAAFSPRPIIYRANDFKTNEYRSLEGGEEFEPQEENPMIGFRGCFRYLKDPTIFQMELEAIKRVREQYGLRNIWLMIPVVRTVSEMVRVKKLVEAAGLHRSHDFKLGMMCEVPANVILADEFCKVGIDFMSIGSNDLTQMTLALDRDNPTVAEEFDERNEAILTSIKYLIGHCHRHGVVVGICGQAPSEYKEFAEKLVEFGIDSISVNPDVVDVTRRVVAAAEQRMLLRRARETHARVHDDRPDPLTVERIGGPLDFN